MNIDVVINYIFRRSFKALEFNIDNKNINIDEWSEFKDETFLKMNKFVFRYVS